MIRAPGKIGTQRAMFLGLLMLGPIRPSCLGQHSAAAQAAQPASRTGESIAQRAARLRPKATYYVNAKAGNDGNSGLSDARAFATLSRAAAIVRPGDTVLVRPGSYVGFQLECVGPSLRVTGEDARISFVADQGVTITAPPPHDVTGNAITVNWSDGGADNRICPVTIQNFTIDGSTGAIANNGIYANRCDAFKAVNNRVFKCKGQGIFSRYGINVVVKGNQCYDNGTKNTQHGIYITNSPAGALIAQNVCYKNAGSGIHTNGDQSEGGDRSGMMLKATIEGNICHDNGANEINADGLRDSTVRNNLLYNCVGPALHIFTGTSSGPSSGNVIHNNTIVAAKNQACIELQDAPGAIIFNNILCGDQPQYTLELPDAASFKDLSCDYNLYTDGTIFDGAEPLTLARWQLKHHQDAHSRVIAGNNLDAVFLYRAKDDYHLKVGSPACDGGTQRFKNVLAAPLDLEHASPRAAGRHRIGAYESSISSR